MREDQQGNIRIMVRRPGATAAVPLTDGVGHERDPTISADGSHVAFASDRNNALAGLHTVDEIFVIGIDGQGLTQVTNSPIGQGNGSDYPAFSPDGTRIAYAQDDANDHGEIWVTDLRTGSAKQVSNQPNSSAGAFAPTWSPDGSRLAFERGPHGAYTIWVVGATGGGEQQLPVAPFDTNNSIVHWLPDGQHLLTGQRSADGTGSVVQVDATTGALQTVPLTGDPYTPAPCGSGQVVYVTDPDGLVFLGGGPQPSVLMLAGLDGSNPTVLLTDATGYGATSPMCAAG